jgi:hypothetical protein
MSQLTVAEAEVMDNLARAWNAFLKLKAEHPDDLSDFRHHLHACQRIVMARTLFSPAHRQSLKETLP